MRALPYYWNIWDEWSNVNRTDYFLPQPKDMEEKDESNKHTKEVVDAGLQILRELFALVVGT